jgi:hypothetical protein
MGGSAAVRGSFAVIEGSATPAAAGDDAQSEVAMSMPDRSRLLAYARARRAALHWVDRYQPKGAMYPAVCRSCGATEWQGHWRWDEVPPGLPPVLCPACERIRDGAAAHRVVLTGALPPQWPAVRELIAQVERAEVQADPLQRVLRIDIGDDRVEVPTTGLRIARQLVAAILRRWRHGLRVQFDEERTTIEWLPQRASPAARG